jgi:hypothetical protein
MKRQSNYKLTFFDKHGPDAELRLKAYGHGAMVFGTVVGAAFLIGTIGRVNMFAFVPLTLTLLGAMTLSGIAVFGATRLGSMAGDVATYVTEGGSSTPYQEQFSQMQALVMQEKYGEALELFEHQIAMTPGEPRVRVAAADLYGTHGKNPKRAAELYREVQRIPNVASGHDIYVTNKLADLYLGPLKEPGRALVEFRKLASRYPNSAAAKNAQLAIANLKPQIVQGTAAPPPDVWAPPTIDRNNTPPSDTPGMPGY